MSGKVSGLISGKVSGKVRGKENVKRVGRKWERSGKVIRKVCVN